LVKLDLGRTRRGLVLAGVAAAALASGGCTALDDALAKVPFFSFMTHSPAFDPYEAPRPAPPNTVPFESPLGAPLEPPLPATDAALRAFGDTVANPFPMSEEVLAAGAAAFQTHCFVCHGPAGEGNGPATGLNRFPLGPSLMTPNARSLSDGYIYGIIRVGRGLMPAYGGRIPYAERWYIVNYVRQLQQQASGGTPAATQPAAPGRE
jgi:mono/diheme cytochrome c family protein